MENKREDRINIKAGLVLVFLCLLCIFAPLRASAASVNVVKSAKTVSGGTWAQGKSGMFYRYSGGTWAKNVWLNIDGKIYRFNSKGLCLTGWITYGGNRYYADLKNGLYISRFRTVNKIKCYFLSDGTLARSQWVKIGTKYYYFLSTGRMRVSSMFTLNGKTYYVDSSGARVAGMWVSLNGKRYYFNKNGVMLKDCWIKSAGKYYYLDSDGAMATSKWIDGYYVSASGARLTNCVIGGYYYDETGKKTTKVFSGKYIFIGDSRVVGISNSVSDPDTEFIAEIGAGYSWLVSTAGPTLETYLNTNPNVTVFLCFGVNDLGNISSYLSYYLQLTASYPATKFYFVSVNPVDESLEQTHGYTIENAGIETFNTMLKAAFPSFYIDCYSYLSEEGFETFDGLHYTAETCQKIYNYLIAQS